MADKMLREVYGEALVKYGKPDPRVMVLDADVANASRSVLFGKECPERFFNTGIAEANMAAMAAGMASVGMTPFVNTFAAFMSTICSLSIKTLIGYSGYNVRLVGCNNGVTGGCDGSTHHALDDLAVMRCVPGLLVLYPGDRHIMDWMVRELVQSYRGPAYLSVSRNPSPDLYDEREAFALGEAKRLREGGDATLIACGLSVHRALRAAERLAGEDGVECRVLDMFTIKPIDTRAILEAADDTGAIVTAEEHSVIGGLGSAVADELCAHGRCPAFGKIGVRDCYTSSGRYAELIHAYGMDEEAIRRAVLAALRK